MFPHLPQRIIVQTSTVSSSGGGTFNETWSDTYSRWANVSLRTAKDSFNHNKENQFNEYEIIMRKENFTNKNKLKYNTKQLRIKSVADYAQRGNIIRILAEEELE